MDTIQNASSTWLDVKEGSKVQAKKLFQDSEIVITSEVKRH